MYSSDGEWDVPLAPPSGGSGASEERRQPRETQDSYTGHSVVSSGLSDLDAEPDYVRGLAQRATEPQYKQIRQKGPFVYEKQSFREGEHFYEKERPLRPTTAGPSTSSPARQSSLRRSDSGANHSRSERFDSRRSSVTRRSSASISMPRSISRSPSPERRGAGDGGRRRRVDRQSSQRRSERTPSDGSLPPARSSGSGPSVVSDRSRSASPVSRYDSYVSSDREEIRRDAGGGDVSMWGRERESVSDRESMRSMSSGLSPRASRPRERDFDVVAATRTLRWAGEKYTYAQMMRKEGTAPEAYGVVEDMPTRMAYEQLNVLAGMAGKVQNVIEHNRRIFERRVQAADRAELSRAFQAWRAARYGSVRKQQVLARAVARIMRGKMARAFYSWKDKFNLVDKFLAMKRKGIAVMRRGRLKRTFMEWQQQVEERAWRHQLYMRDNENDRLVRLCRKYENRPVTIMRNRSMRNCLWAWHAQAAERIRLHRLLKKGAQRFRMRRAAMAWNTWLSAVERKQFLMRTIARLANNLRSRVWQKWIEVLGRKEWKRRRMARAVKHMQNRIYSAVWNAFLAHVDLMRKVHRTVRHWTNRQMSKAWRRWVEYLDIRARQKLILLRAVNKMRFKTVFQAWEAWHDAIDDRKWEELYGTKEALLQEVGRMRGENERLRRDNERFVRLIDSGEWGRGRVAELVQAGEIMKGERDALMKLIGSLRREYEAVQEAKAAQEAELQEMKNRISKFGGPGRNRMLVKGGSSFNGLVRQMKTEMAEAAQHGKVVDPNRMYEVNRLSMDHVQVFPDGELTVEAVNPERSTLDRPMPIGKAIRRGSHGGAPVTRTRIPAEFQGRSSGREGPPSHQRPPSGSAAASSALNARMGRNAGMNSTG